MHRTVFVSCVREDLAAVFALHRCHLVHLRIIAPLTYTVDELMTILRAVPFRHLPTFLRAVLLSVFTEPLLSSGGGQVELLPEVFPLPLEVDRPPKFPAMQSWPPRSPGYGQTGSTKPVPWPDCCVAQVFITGGG